MNVIRMTQVLRARRHERDSYEYTAGPAHRTDRFAQLIAVFVRCTADFREDGTGQPALFMRAHTRTASARDISLVLAIDPSASFYC
jgi:hypothetical protein